MFDKFPKVDLSIKACLDTTEKIIFALVICGIWFTEYPDSKKLFSTAVAISLYILKAKNLSISLKTTKIGLRLDMDNAKNKESPPDLSKEKTATTVDAK